MKRSLKKVGGNPGILNSQEYHDLLCISVNDLEVYGIPSEYKIQDGEPVSVECEVVTEEFCDDSAYTFVVGGVSG